MALANPNVADRANSTWWTAPIGVGTSETSAIYMADLPTADPHVVGQLYNADGVVTVSDG